MKMTSTMALVGSALTRAITVEQINAGLDGTGGPPRRSAEVRNVDADARTVEVAFSSETPVPRWFGDEILDHSPGAMIDERLANGAAVLWNHNMDVQIGAVESASISGDRRGRAVLRFGTSAKAEEIWNDIVAGIIRHVSVGYFVRAVRTEEVEGQDDQVTITSWEPYEISMVSVPADASVGVGRSLGNPPEEAGGDGSDNPNNQITEQPEGSGNMERILRNAAGDLVRAEVDADGNIIREIEVLEHASATQALVTRGTEAEQTRVADLMSLGESYSAQLLVPDAIRNGVTVDAFTRQLLDHVQGQQTDGNRALNDDAGHIGLSDEEAGNFSFIRALRAVTEPTNRAAQEDAAFEFEASRAAEQSSGRSARGIMVPMDVLHRALNTGTDGAAGGNTGGLGIANDLQSQSFIDMLVNRSVLLGMATPMAGLVGNLDIPGQASGATGYWIGEDEEVGEGNQELRQIALSPKTAGAYSEITRKMLTQSSFDAEALVRRDLARALGLTFDWSGFYGPGNANQPLGIANLEGLNVVDFANNNPSYGEIVELETRVASDNADVDSMAYIANSKFRGYCKTTEKFTGASGATIWEQGGTVNGSRTEITNQTADGDVFYGNFSDLVVGMWGGLDLTMDPYSNSKRGKLRIVVFQDIDFVHRNVESFALGRNVA